MAGEEHRNLNLSLSPNIQGFIESKVRSGQYATPEDVVAAAITRLMTEDDSSLDPETLAAIEPAEGEFDRGEDRPFEEVAAELRARRHSDRANPDGPAQSSTKTGKIRQVMRIRPAIIS